MPKATVMTKSSQIDARQAPMSNIGESVHSSGVEHIIASPEVTYFAPQGAVEFYTGQDCDKLQNANLKKVRELQEANDALQRQIKQIDKEVKHSNDALTLLAEKERCQLIIARNMGEILKIHAENEARLARIAQIEAENMGLKEEVVSQRDNFVSTRDMDSRYQHAADFFLTKSQIEKNTNELFDLTQE